MSKAGLLRLELADPQQLTAGGEPRERTCDFATCQRAAGYRAVFADESWSYLCQQHTVAEARAHGWTERKLVVRAGGLEPRG